LEQEASGRPDEGGRRRSPAIPTVRLRTWPQKQPRSSSRSSTTPVYEADELHVRSTRVRERRAATLSLEDGKMEWRFFDESTYDPGDAILIDLTYAQMFDLIVDEFWK